MFSRCASVDTLRQPEAAAAGGQDKNSAAVNDSKGARSIVLKPLDPDDGHPVQVQQQRRIVDQARGSPVILPR